MKQWQYNLAFVALFSPLAIVAIWYIIFNAVSCEHADWLSCWGQFLTSNWPSWKNAHVKRDGPLYSLAIGFRTALAYAPLATMIGLFWKLGQIERERRMNIYEALRDRDRAIERELLNRLPENQRANYITEIRSSIREAAELWEQDYLPNVIGRQATERLMELLKTHQL